MDINQIQQVIRRYADELKADEQALIRAKATIAELEKVKLVVQKLESKIRTNTQKMRMSERELAGAEFDEVQRKGSVKLH